MSNLSSAQDKNHVSPLKLKRAPVLVIIPAVTKSLAVTIFHKSSPLTLRQQQSAVENHTKG